MKSLINHSTMQYITTCALPNKYRLSAFCNQLCVKPAFYTYSGINDTTNKIEYNTAQNDNFTHKNTYRVKKAAGRRALNAVKFTL